MPRVAWLLVASMLVASCSSVQSPESGGAPASAKSAPSDLGSSSSLTGKLWQLTALTHRVANGLGGVPEGDQANYTIEFMAGGKYQAKADCNQTSGTYATTSDGGLTIERGPATLAACPEGSLSDQYIQSLTIASSYAIADGQLTITLNDGWTLEFK